MIVRCPTDSENVQGVEDEEDGVVDEACQECTQHHVGPAVVYIAQYIMRCTYIQYYTQKYDIGWCKV